MPRLRHIDTGVVVSVSDETLLLLGAEWVPVELAQRPVADKPVKAATTRRNKTTS